MNEKEAARTPSQELNGTVIGLGLGERPCFEHDFEHDEPEPETPPCPRRNMAEQTEPCEVEEEGMRAEDGTPKEPPPGPPQSGTGEIDMRGIRCRTQPTAAAAERDASRPGASTAEGTTVPAG